MQRSVVEWGSRSSLLVSGPDSVWWRRSTLLAAISITDYAMQAEQPVTTEQARGNKEARVQATCVRIVATYGRIYYGFTREY